jgi:crotonobetainyl-CoA:carnitine CoA-transferase CaiB-like acyl-CoA transferase
MGKSALEGIKVIELASGISGPYCGKLLADMGADVIKVEPPQGDPARQAGPFPGDVPHPEKSGLFLYNNTSKRGVVLDLETPDGLQAFKRLIPWADILIDNHSPADLPNKGLDWDQLQVLNPGLIYTSIHPYGRTGPRAPSQGDELTLMHAGGLGFTLPGRQKDVSRAPVKLGGSQVGYWGATTAALATLAAMIGQRNTGHGQLIDISLQEVMVAMMQINITSTRYLHGNWIGGRVPISDPAMGRMAVKDGYVLVTAGDDHHFLALRELMGNPPWIAGEKWESRVFRADNMRKIGKYINEWMLTQDKNGIHHKAGKMGIPIAPFNTVEDVMKSDQYINRRYFVEVDHPRAGRYQYPGWPYIMEASPPKVHRPAPLLGQHNQEVFNDPSIMGASPKPVSRKKKRLPLEGLRVLEFCQMWAGPYATSLLGSLGAEVIRIENPRRLDAMRRGVLKKINQSQFHIVPPNQNIGFNCLNMNKKCVALDISQPEGMALVKKLVGLSDIVFDNLRAGAMEKIGLGYEALKAVKPDIIAVSSSGRGQQEPERDYRGYAMMHQSIGGGAYLTGYPDDAPVSSGGDIDLINAIAVAEVMLAAVVHRRQTGEGQFIDYSQTEFISSALGEYFLEYQMTGRIPERQGNAHPVYAPHNVYKAYGLDRWVALEVHSDEEFAVLTKTIDRPDLVEDPKFSTMAARKANEAELDRIIEEWTSEMERDYVEEIWVNAGLMATISRNGRDLYQDEQLRARNMFVTIAHPEMEDMEMVRAPWIMPGGERPFIRAPLLGEHNDYVFKDLLKISDRDMTGLMKKKIILKVGKP